MKRLTLALLFGVSLALAPGAILAKTAGEAVHSQAACAKDPALCDSQSIFAPGGLLNDVALALIFLVGAVSTLYVIIGGLKYALSAGDPGSIKSAKDTILYALIGLVVALMSYAIIEFVVFRVTEAGG